MKGNDGLPKRRILSLAVLGLAVLLGVWSVLDSLMNSTPASSTRKTSDVIGPPPENRLNKDGYRMCLLNDQVDGILMGQPPLQMDIPLPVRFQCAGPAYEQFANQLEALVKRKAEHSKTWAQRPQPIPPRRKDSQGEYPIRRLLFFGSSHLRQVITALLCQYSDQVIRTAKIHDTSKWASNSLSLHITLQQNIHLYVILNPPFVYHPEWERLLEQYVLQMPLQIFDLLVVSKFHDFIEERHSQPLLHFLADHEGAVKKAVVNVDPPSFLDVTSLYDGPMIYVSLFAKYGTQSYGYVVETIEHMERGLYPPDAALEHTGGTLEIDWAYSETARNQTGKISPEIEDLFTYKAPLPEIPGTRRRLVSHSPQTRTNLWAIDGRQYVSPLGECSTDTYKTVGGCITNPEDPFYSEGHKCFGFRGGHPDLIVYDLIEAMYQLLKGKS